MKTKYLATLVLAAAVGFASAAMGDQFSPSYYFSFNGHGISASGVFTVTSGSSSGAEDITSISGTFSDTNVNVSGAITGLYQPVSYVSNTLATPGVAFTTGGLSYDDTFYPGANSPLVCYDINPTTHLPELTYPFSGGVFDIFGVAFDISGGYAGELWSNGNLPDSNGTFPGAPGYVPNLVYAAALANATGLLDNPNSVPGPGVPPPGRFGALVVAPTPEPASLVLFGIGLLGMAALCAGKMDLLRSPRK